MNVWRIKTFFGVKSLVHFGATILFDKIIENENSYTLFLEYTKICIMNKRTNIILEE